jgi:outer membrane lipoprotein SlyB
MHNNHLTDNIGGTLGGAIGTVAGSILGWITINSVIETACLAIVGAVVGFYINKLLKWLHK